MTKQERFQEIIKHNENVDTVKLLEMAYTLALDDLSEKLSIILEEAMMQMGVSDSFITSMEKALDAIDELC